MERSAGKAIGTEIPARIYAAPRASGGGLLVCVNIYSFVEYFSIAAAGVDIRVINYDTECTEDRKIPRKCLSETVCLKSCYVIKATVAAQIISPFDSWSITLSNALKIL